MNGSRSILNNVNFRWRKSTLPTLSDIFILLDLPFLYKHRSKISDYIDSSYKASLNLPKTFAIFDGNLYNPFIHLTSAQGLQKKLNKLTQFNLRNLEVSLPPLKIQQLIKDYSLLSTFITNLQVTPFRTKTRFSFSKIHYFSSLETLLFSPTSVSFKPSYVSTPCLVSRIKQNVRPIYRRFHKNIKYNLFSVWSGLHTRSLTSTRSRLGSISETFKNPLKFVWSKRPSIRVFTFLPKTRGFIFRSKPSKLSYIRIKKYKFNTRKPYLRLKVRVKKRKFNGLRFKLRSSLRSRNLIDNNASLIDYNHSNYESSRNTNRIDKTYVPSKLISPSKNLIKITPSIYSYTLYISNPLLYKLVSLRQRALGGKLGLLETSPYIESSTLLNSTNLKTSNSFRKVFKKKAFDYYSMCSFSENIIPVYYNTLIRFLEHSTGSPVIIQFYPFMYQSVTSDWVTRYRYWLPRMRSYERSLGHKFFLEEALHIMHLAFSLRDSKLFSSWLKAIILRISFWRTRSIFRFLKYLMISHFSHVFSDLKVKGLKIKLKGKISVAGNSRKRSILYRVGKTSHSELSLRVDHTKTTVNTFTGVMGFQVWIFY